MFMSAFRQYAGVCLCRSGSTCRRGVSGSGSGVRVSRSALNTVQVRSSDLAQFKKSLAKIRLVS